MSDSKNTPRSGFALVISLSLMALILLLLVTLSSMTRLETQAASQTKAQVLVRQNTLLGLSVAIGNLQSLAGPDRRTTARADLLANDTGGSPNPASRWWVGVGHSDPAEAINLAGRNVQWLLSGLDSDDNPSVQLTTAFPDPVPLIGAASVDLASLTGGAPIQAGKVALPGEAGAFAWLVDDEGLKAKLGPSDPGVDNADPDADGRLDVPRTVLPGGYDLTGLPGLSAFSNNLELLARASAWGQLENEGIDPDIAADHWFDYTLAGFGVLADARMGGLKRDLTAAFENPQAFSELFPSTGTPPYIAMDEDKFGSPAAGGEIEDHGYINFGIFRDFYNLKDAVSGGEFFPGFVQEQSVLVSSPQKVREGERGPHQFTEDGHPYGDFGSTVSAFGGGPLSGASFSRNPITPILGFFQQNAWLEYNEDAGGTNPRYITRAQLWAGIYNPYNIRLRMDGNSMGPAVIGYPQILVTVDDGPDRPLWRNRALEGEAAGSFRRIYAEEGFSLGPGRTQYMGFRENLPAEDAKVGESTFSTNLLNATDKSAFRQFDLAAPSSGTVDMRVEFPFLGAFLAVGVESSTPAGRDHFSQVFFSPFAYNHYVNEPGQDPEGATGGSGRPAKVLQKPGVPVGDSRMSNTAEAFYAFRLRMTTEPDSRLRPIIDGNIRAIWNNPRWDYNLNLPLLATYSPANGMVGDQIPNVDISGNEGFGFWGDGGAERVILFDIPRNPLVSIGQLQHAAAGRFSYEPSYIVGNSYANIRIPLDDWSVLATDTFMPSNAVWRIDEPFRLYDASYLVNETLFDGYAFTTIPQGLTDSQYGEILSGQDLLPNPRYRPYQPEGLAFDAANLDDSASGLHNAGFVLSDGAFNVNSTSADGWRAFLSGTKGLPFLQMDANGEISGISPSVNGVRFPRVQSILGEPWESTSNDNYWIGFRALSDDEIGDLAERIVELIKERGPFRTVGDFVNRSLVNGDEGKSGVLQAALDEVINTGLGAFEDPADSGAFPQIADDSTQGAGFPGQLLQGDILQALAPYLQTRSDTFKVRAYGEGPDGDAGPRSWCEVVVQRFPDAVPEAGGGTLLEEMASPSSRFGRAFRIVSFRWLNEDEV